MNLMASQQATGSVPDTHHQETFAPETFWLYNSALAATSCGIVISDVRLPDNPIIYCNPAFLEITGYSREDVIGRNCRFLQGPDTDPDSVEQIRQALRDGRECQVVLKNYRKDGKLFWNQLTISPVRDASGCITHYIGVQTDITQRKLAEERQQLMQFSIDCAADAAFYIQPDGTFFYVNQAACQLLGYSRDELLTMSIQSIDLDVSEPNGWRIHWQDVKQYGSLSRETQYHTKDGRRVPVEITLNYLKFNDQEYTCAFARDISDRKQAEAALQKSKELYRTLAKNFPKGAVLLFDQDLRYLIAEGVELATAGLSKQTVEGKTLWEVFSPDVCEAFAPAYHAALAGETQSFEFSFQNRVYLVYVMPVTNEDGEIFAGMAMTQNITQRKQAEKALERSNALLKAQQEAAIEGVLVIDEKRAITSYNRRFCEMWQIPQHLRHAADKDKILNCVLPFIAHPQKVFGQMEYLEENPTLAFRDEVYLSNGLVFDCYTAPALSPEGECYGRIWFFRDITERKQTEARLEQQATRELLVRGMNERIRQSLNLREVLNTAVVEVRQFLKCDRVVIYRFNPDWTGTIAVESVGLGWTPALGNQIEDNCFKETKAFQYQQGRVRAINDIYSAGLTPCHIALLERFQVRATLIVPLLQGNTLWGLLIAHHCSTTRQWQELEIELLQELSVQLGIAIQQAALFEQLAEELRERKVAEAALRESEAVLKQQAQQLAKALYERKQAQLHLVQTEKMSSLGQLVAGIAHEINNPVTFIHGNIIHAKKYTHDLLKLVDLYNKYCTQSVLEIEELKETIDFEFLKEDFPKLLNSMNMGANRIRQIILSLRNFSRLDEAERKLVDIHEGIENTLLILQHRIKPEAANIKLIKQFSQLPLVECYPGQLNQVFMNLITNAIDALENSGPEPRVATGRHLTGEPRQCTPRLIKITTEVTQAPEGSISKCEQYHTNKRIVIRISDNGPGIPENVKQRIFDPFFTTKSVGKGTGLGLSISYQIVVEKHGGKLECLSEPGNGTEFVVTLPLQQSHLQIEQRLEQPQAVK